MTGVVWVPPAWVNLTALTASLLVGVWAVWDCWQPPKVRLPVRLTMLVTLGFGVQWWTFLLARWLGVWNRAEYADIVAPYVPLVFSPAGPWGIWFAAHWFARRSKRDTLDVTSDMETTP